MPYGVAKDKGGDSMQNTARMEACVESVMKNSPKLSKESAIRICKDRLFGNKKG